MTDRPTTPPRSHGARPRRSRSRRRPAFAPWSADAIDARRAAVPTIAYPPELPVSARRAEIAAAIRDHQVVIVAGETGSGKTTQIPKICLELGRGIQAMIGHTQPRRIAARSVAERLSAELGVELGGAVGYQVRFTDEVSSSTLIKLMTDGILLAEIQRDPLLRRYDTIIVDEAHERSLTIDFILGYLRQLLPQRPDLKVVITSATIDSARFAAHFASTAPRSGPDDPAVPAPVIEVSGRTYPVEIRYRPLVPDLDDAQAGDGPAATGLGKTGNAAPDADAIDQPTAICRAVDELSALGPGDILVFCSGEREIRDAADALSDHLGPRHTAPGARNATPGAVEVLPLFARLSAADQHRVFAAHSHRRVVLATNIAETSLTVPGVHYVIDTGLARISRYSARTKVQRLPIEPISQASANQRSGRCGRVADGVAIRLYSRSDFDSRPEYTEPEILRTSLASVILQMASLGLGRIEAFGFVDPPDTRAIRDGITLLTELGALAGDPNGPGRRRGADHEVRLTDVGRRLAGLPIDPRLARMLLAAGEHGVVREVLVIVAALSVQDVRERPLESQQAADEKHRRFADPASDFLALLNLWTYLSDQQQSMGSSAFRRLCRSEHLHYLRVREWQDLHAQLRRLLRPLGLHEGPPSLPDEGADTEAGEIRRVRVDADAVHRALLAGLLSHIGSWDERRREYAGARGARFSLFPGSALARKPPAWIMAAELVETSRLFARTAARITPEVVEAQAGHLLTRSYSEPYWSTKQGAAMCREKVLLYGVTLAADRPAPLARVDRELARELFLRHALVQGEWRTQHRFFARNAELLAEAAELEHRVRRRDLLVDDDALFDFYDERVPENVVSARHFDAWWKDARRHEPDLLTFSLGLLVPDAHDVDSSGFPTAWTQGDLTLPLTYQFTPGEHADGVTAHVPLALLPRVRPDGFDWLVPGLLPELVTATIRALPKPIRVQLVPAPDVAAQICALLPEWSAVAPAPDGAPSFAEAFAAAAKQAREADVPSAALAEAQQKLPAHLRMTFQVADDRGRVVDSGPDLAHLQRRLAAQSQTAVRTAVRAALEAAQAAKGPTPPGPAQAPGPSMTPAPTEPASSHVIDLAPVTRWQDVPGGVVPDQVTTRGPGGLEIRGYPALVVEGPEGGSPTRGPGDVVALRVLADAGLQAPSHTAGVRALLLRELGLPAGRVTSRWTGAEALVLASSPYRSTEALVHDAQAAAVAALTRDHDLAAVRTERAYREARSHVRDHLEDAVHAVVARAVEALRAGRELDAQVRGTASMALLPTLTQLRDHSASLIYPGFIAATPPDRLRDLARYLCADAHRLAKAQENPARDAQLAWQVSELEDALAMAAPPTLAPERAARAEEARWLLEELRVSLFAQQLGTSQPVSPKRLRSALAAI